MSDSDETTADAPEQQPPAGDELLTDEEALTDDELRAAYEAELKRITVDDVLVQTVVSLLNLGARRAGLTGAGDEEIDWAQVGQAIEATRALLPLSERTLGPDVKQVREALSQLQMAFARSGAAPAPGAEAEPGAAAKEPGGTGPAQSSGRLWVPGQ